MIVKLSPLSDLISLWLFIFFIYWSQIAFHMPLFSILNLFKSLRQRWNFSGLLLDKFMPKRNSCVLRLSFKSYLLSESVD